MTKSEKTENANYLNKVLSMMNEGAIWVNPGFGTYTIKAGKFYSTPLGVKKLMKHTPKAFHKNIRLAK